MRGRIVVMMLLIALAGCAESQEELAETPEDAETDDTAPDTSEGDDTSEATSEAMDTTPELLVSASAVNGTAPLNVTLDIQVLNGTGLDGAAWSVSENGTELANGTGLPANVTLILDAGDHDLLVATGDLTQTVTINVTAAAPSITLEDFTTYPGMVVPLSAGIENATCTWDIPDAMEITDAGACDTGVRFPGVGTFPATVSAEGVSHTVQVTTVFPETSSRVSGSLYMYNADGAGVSNIIAIGAGEWHYVTGDTVSTQGRGMGGDLSGIVGGAEYIWLDADGNVVAGPLSAGSGSGGDWAGASLDIDTDTFPEDGGRYYLGAVAYMEDGPIWVQDTNDGRSGFKGFLVHHAA